MLAGFSGGSWTEHRLTLSNMPGIEWVQITVRLNPRKWWKPQWGTSRFVHDHAIGPVCVSTIDKPGMAEHLRQCDVGDSTFEPET